MACETQVCGCQADLPSNATLQEYLVFAAVNNPQLEAAFDRWREAVQRSYQAGYLPDPAFQYKAFIEAVETRVGPQRYELWLEQAIPWPAKLLIERSMAIEAAKAAKQEFFEARNALFYQVKSSYYEYVYTKNAIVITESNRNLLEHFLKVVETRQKVGGPLSDSVKIQVEWITVDDRLQRLINELPSVMANLNALLNRPMMAPLPSAEIIEQPEVADIDDLRRQVIDENPQLLALRHRITEERKSIGLAKTNQRPNFLVGVNYINTGPARTPGVPGSGMDSVQARVALTLPIWRDLYRAQIKEAQQRASRVQNEREDLKNRLEAQLEEALFQLKEGDRRIILYRDTLLPELNLLLETTQRGYEVGKEDVLTLVDVERQLLDIQLILERAYTDRAQAVAEIDWLVGKHSSWQIPCGKRQAGRVVK
ncbi:MAG: TolC family protein [Candidatus Obscuribacterales bacterium]